MTSRVYTVCGEVGANSTRGDCMKLLRFLSLALLGCMPALSWAQQAPASPSAPAGPALKPRIETTLPESEGRIKLDVVVTDKSGKPFTGLELKDFTLLDNGQPSRILSFRASGAAHQADPPAEVILLIDALNIEHQAITVVRQQLANFLRRNGGRLALPVSLYVLTDQGLFGQLRPTVDGNALAAEVSQINTGMGIIYRTRGNWGEIGLFKFSASQLMTIANNQEKKPGRKLLIWIGPGWPWFDTRQSPTTANQQRQYFDSIVQFSTRLREARIAVYSIAPGPPDSSMLLYEDFLKGAKTAGEANTAALNLWVLAVQSGGRVLGPDNEMAAQIERCFQDATAFYTLSFNPPLAAGPDEYHDLKVQIDRPKLTARTSTGFYNQP